MTKDQLQQELQEKVKPGIKPSHLKRSRSLNDLPNNAENEEIFVDASEDNPVELKAKISELEDQILQLRLEKIKEFGEYYEKKKELAKELEENINYGTQEITKLENKLRTINKKKLELQDQLSQVQGKNARLELKLINAENQGNYSTSLPCWWTDYRWLLISLLTYCLIIWLLSKDNNRN